ncbi:CopG family transcriptional regulator [Nostoc flagelliforme FACHB-838]|uniref:CopG family transcriptional regulator n=1 Tax=Nostoc flagelliforme FACHB-838 TaxID=2692904 RepID=A0ABR8DU28_9NOSO|nr:CopG family transcriptional regulator [Nostoc flagelliforme]MBD2532400.1 CopG family transcriptional regulator [Nostoc flagelliforme FACHB-838]
MNKKWAVKRITLNLASVESQKLERYCAMAARPATDVIRELIRSLSITDLSASEQTKPCSSDPIVHSHSLPTPS